MNAYILIDSHFSDTTPSSRKDDFFEAILAKVLFVKNLMRVGDKMIFSGDVFEKSHLSNRRLYQLCQALPKDCYSVVGNHDVPRLAKSRIKDSSLGILFATGLVKPLVREVFGGFTFVGMDFDDDPTTVDVLNSIVVCHKALGYQDQRGYFDNWEFWSFEEIQQQSPLMVIAGHDHEPHEPVYFPSLFGTTVCVRPGSISRGTAHQFNKDRKPQYVVVDCDTGEVSSHEILAAKSADEVFVEKPLIKVRAEEELRSLVKTLKESSRRKLGGSSSSIEEVLDSLECTKSVKRRLISLLRESGVILEGLSL